MTLIMILILANKNIKIVIVRKIHSLFQCQVYFQYANHGCPLPLFSNYILAAKPHPLRLHLLREGTLIDLGRQLDTVILSGSS